MKLLFVFLLLVSKPCFVATLHEPMSHENPPIVIVHDPLFGIIEPSSMQNLVSSYLCAVEEHPIAFVKKGFETDSGHHPSISSSGFVR